MDQAFDGRLVDARTAKSARGPIVRVPGTHEVGELVGEAIKAEAERAMRQNGRLWHVV